MNQEEFHKIQYQARRQFSDHWHTAGAKLNQDERESCGACCLNGYHPRGERRDFINYAGWARLYIQAGKFIPQNVRFDFLAELASDNRPYAEALKQDIKDFGINVEAGPFKNAVRSVLGLYD